MHILIGVFLFVALGYPWLLGNWVIATLMSIAFAWPALLMTSISGGLAMVALVIYGLIWAPFLIRRHIRAGEAYLTEQQRVPSNGQQYRGGANQNSLAPILTIEDADIAAKKAAEQRQRFLANLRFENSP